MAGRKASMKRMITVGFLSLLMLPMGGCFFGSDDETTVMPTGGNGPPTPRTRRRETDPDPPVQLPGGVGAKNFKRILVTFETLSAVSKNNANVQGFYTEAVNRLPSTNEIFGVTAASTFAITGLAAEFCNRARIAEENRAPATRDLFGAFDFNATPNQFSVADREEAIRDLALRFWQREETDVERSILLEFLQLLADATGSNIDHLALGMCTAMLSSLDVIQL